MYQNDVVILLILSFIIEKMWHAVAAAFVDFKHFFDR